MIFFNLLGALFLFGSVGAGLLVSGLLTGEWQSFGALGFFICGALSLGVDLLYRAGHSPEEGPGRFVFPTTGGQIVFIPVWVFGIAWLIMGCVDLASGGGEARARNDDFMRETIAMLEETVGVLRKAKDPADWEQAREEVSRCERRIREMAAFYERLDRSEKKRIDGKYGERVSRLIEQLRLLNAPP